MKHLFLKFFLVIVLSTLLSDCVKNSDDGFYIEAEINGVKWKGDNQPGDLYANGYLAVGGNSSMKLWINTPTGRPPQTFNFSSYDTLKLSNFSYKDTLIYNCFLSMLDSKVKLNLNTIIEKGIDHFEIEQAKEDMNYKLVGSIPATGTSTSLKQYSLTLENVDLLNLGRVYQRIKTVTKSGTWIYSSITLFYFSPGTPQAAWYTDGKLYMPLDNNQSKVTITAYGPGPREMRGTFSFNYVNETGDTIRVTNGNFHVR